jgi:hypothetical protein
MKWGDLDDMDMMIMGLLHMQLQEDMILTDIIS